MKTVAVRHHTARILQIPINVLADEVSGLADRGMMIYGAFFALQVVRCAGPVQLLSGFHSITVF
jgi:hypothetical protein